jgi:hypothetical protein
LSCKSEGTLYSVLRTGKYLKEEPAYSDFQEAVVVLNMMASINMNTTCEEFCIIKPTLEMFLNKESKQIVAVSVKYFWWGTEGSNSTRLLSYVLYSCAQRLQGTGFLKYELLLEK